MADTVAPVRMVPADAARSLFGHDHWSIPADIMRAIWQPHARVAVKGCHASSKTFCAADLVLLALYAGADVVTTAPTDDQVRGIMWAQIHAALRDARVTGWGDVLQSGITLPDGNYALGRTTNSGVRFHGYHARPDSWLLMVLDEAPGIEQAIFDAISGISAGGDVRILLLGNPDVPSGPFYDAFTANRQMWQTFTISAFDNPNLAGVTLEELLAMPEHELAVEPRPYLAGRRWVRARYDEWGPSDPRWYSKVLGQFPPESTAQLISLAWVEDCNHAAEYDSSRGEVWGAIDVAGPGDCETTVAIAQGDHVLAIAGFGDSDARGPVLAYLQPWQHRGLRRLNIDSNGIGHYFSRHFADAGYQVRDINVGAGLESDEDKARYSIILRNKYLYSLRERFQSREIRGHFPPAAVRHLTAPKWRVNSRGRIEVESKDEMAKRGIESPDYLDVLALLYAPESGSEAMTTILGAWAGPQSAPSIVPTAPDQRIPWAPKRGVLVASR